MACGFVRGHLLRSKFSSPLLLLIGPFGWEGMPLQRHSVPQASAYFFFILSDLHKFSKKVGFQCLPFCTPLSERADERTAIQQAGAYLCAKGKNQNGHQLGFGLNDIGATHVLVNTAHGHAQTNVAASQLCLPNVRPIKGAEPAWRASFFLARPRHITASEQHVCNHLQKSNFCLGAW